MPSPEFFEWYRRIIEHERHRRVDRSEVRDIWNALPADKKRTVLVLFRYQHPSSQLAPGSYRSGRG